MTRLRGGTNELRIETGRYPITTRDRKLEIHERRCLICMSGEVEDEEHFVMDCGMYEDLRGKMKEMWMKEGICYDKARKEEQGRERILRATLGAGLETKAGVPDKFRKEGLNFCRMAMGRRNDLVRK